jgi:thiol-disulfide isomerase/thioredoxin
MSRDFNRRRFLGAAAMGTAAMAIGCDARAPRLNYDVTTPTGGSQRELAAPSHEAVRTNALTKAAIADDGRLPDFGGAVTWLNSAPLSKQSLRGKVVLVDFWTYSCINSLRELPYVKSWAAKYKDAGLMVIGVHTPEFSFEKNRANVEQAVLSLNVTHPVPMDNDYKIWQAFNNEYWPADYLIDGKDEFAITTSGRAPIPSPCHRGALEGKRGERS